MTIEEVIAKADDLAFNQYTVEQKMGWLSSLDGKIYEELIKTHHSHDCRFMFMPEEGYTSDSEELIVTAPYAENVYVYYLLSQYALFDAEMSKYNQWITMFNAAYEEYANWYNRKHRPKRSGFFRY